MSSLPKNGQAYRISIHALARRATFAVTPLF